MVRLPMPLFYQSAKTFALIQVARFYYKTCAEPISGQYRQRIFVVRTSSLLLEQTAHGLMMSVQMFISTPA
jgi:hypothetical protein